MKINKKALVWIGGSEEAHDLVSGGKTLVEILARKGIPAVLTQGAGIFCDSRAEQYSVAILYSQEKIFTDREQRGLEQFVKNGRGLVPLHASNVMSMPPP